MITRKSRLNSSKIKSFLFGLFAVAILMSNCKSNKVYEVPRSKPFKSRTLPAPPGMVYVPSGTFFYKTSLDTSDVGKNISLSGFFIDKTEVTNKQYKEFVTWVADSIAVTDYLNDDSYFLSNKRRKANTDGKRYINWKKVRRISPIWQSRKPEIQEKIAPMLTTEGNKTVLNEDLIRYEYSYLKNNGNQKEYVTVRIPVMPVEDIWSKDFPNAQLISMDANYFTQKAYENHPVVGVNWHQARAYSDWRGKDIVANVLRKSYLSGFQLIYSLPTEAQWQYAAGGKIDPQDESTAVRLTYGKKSKDKMLAVNFKQGEGTYSKDGNTFTAHVKSYMPNAFGIFNMAGNVAEWTLDAFSPSASVFINDLNPVLLYDADNEDGETLKRKVVRGGSWKDNGEQINIETRSYESQDEPHSYIGFRCVMSAFEIPTKQSKTRSFK